MENIKTIELLIAVIVAYIAIQNYRLSGKQLKLQLYEKRYAVYISLKNLFRHIMREANIDSTTYRVYMLEVSEAHWLFNSHTNDYLKQINDNAWELLLLREKLYDPDTKLPIGRERNNCAMEKEYLLNWFNEQWGHASKIFEPYFNVDEKLYDKIKNFISKYFLLKDE